MFERSLLSLSLIKEKEKRIYAEMSSNFRPYREMCFGNSSSCENVPQDIA
jgi:hypothetical protein